MQLLLASVFIFSVHLSLGADVILQQNREEEVGKSELDLSCECETRHCGCCLYLDIPEIGINDTGCVNITYLPQEFAIVIVFTLDKKVIIRETISGKNPPPICFGLPFLKKEEASVCLDFYNLTIINRVFSGCIRLYARLYQVVVEQVNLGCYKIRLPWQKVHTLEMEKLKQIIQKSAQNHRINELKNRGKFIKI